MPGLKIYELDKDIKIKSVKIGDKIIYNKTKSSELELLKE